MIDLIYYLPELSLYLHNIAEGLIKIKGKTKTLLIKKQKKERLKHSFLMKTFEVRSAYSSTKLTVPFAKDSTRANDSTR